MQFQGHDPGIVLRGPALAVDLGQLRQALWWLAPHSSQWLEATGEYAILDVGNMGNETEAVLEAYRADLNGLGRGAPQSLLRANMMISEESASVYFPGPADAARATSSESERDVHAPPQHRRKVAAARSDSFSADGSAVVVGSGMEEYAQIDLINAALVKHGLMKAAEKTISGSPGRWG